jgi:hypothetical protein
MEIILARKVLFKNELVNIYKKKDQIWGVDKLDPK